MWDYFDIQSSTGRGPIITDRSMPGAIWFPQARVNYARRLVESGPDDAIAIEHYSELREPGSVGYGELRRQVRNFARALRALGVQPGDRVAAYVPNVPEAVVAMLATTGIGALWSSCSPDFGVSSVLDRFKQIEPKVLLLVDGYRYGGRDFDRRQAAKELISALDSVESVIHLPYLFAKANSVEGPNARVFSELIAGDGADDDPLAEDFAFNHPLWIVYSSGTTGLPKGMVHGHGGVLIEHLKFQTLHSNMGPESKLFFYTTTGWIMFNLLVAGLITGSSIVQYDGNPAYPDFEALWRIVDRSKVTNFGTSPTFVNTLAQHDVVPRQNYSLEHLECVLCTGSPLTPESFEWFYQNVKQDLWVASISGGTDVATGFVGSVPTLPVHSGEIQAPNLGVDVCAFDHEGNAVVGEEGELVVRQPMPTMPLYFWNDAHGVRYKESYFETYPGVWRHGDLLKVTERGSYVISGRSDSTLNRFGVRIGTSEIYRAVESLSEVVDSLVVHLDADGGESKLYLLVVLGAGAQLDEALSQKLRIVLREQRSPRHVPDEILEITAVPYTLTGKKMEVPVKRILLGADPFEVANPDAMSNPESLAQFAELAKSLRSLS